MTYLSESDAGKRIYQRCDEWAVYSEPGPGVTRLYLSNEHRAAADKLLDWMAEAGMDAHIDEAGNIIGRYHAETGAGPYLIMGSHQDSVIEGGKYDGPLGILIALDCVSVLNSENVRFPFGIEVVGFGDEEGSRFKTTLAGSRAIVGTVDDELLNATDPDGCTMAQALTDFGLDPANISKATHSSDDVVGYVEVHIEQGPVLEDEDLPIGVVTGISAQRRCWINFNSEPNHAGTVPMKLRTDAIVCAAECILAIEKAAGRFKDTVGTVGSIEARPGLANVICGNVTLSLDLRSPSKETLNKAFEIVKSEATAAAKRQGVSVEFEVILDLDPCPCSGKLIQQLETAVRETGVRAIQMPSGAGHDGMAMSQLTDIGMIFVRCKGGISHNPAESVTVEDVGAGAAAILQFVRNFEQKRKMQEEQ